MDKVGIVDVCRYGLVNSCNWRLGMKRCSIQHQISRCRNYWHQGPVSCSWRWPARELS